MLIMKANNKYAFYRAMAFACALLFGALPAVYAQGGGGGKADKKDETVGPRPAEIMPQAPYELLLDVVNKGDGFVAVGARGDIVLSEDGLHWDQAQVPVRATLTAVDFVDKQHGWAVGHAASIVATKDGGKTWQLQHFDPGLETPFLDVKFFDEKNGFAIGAYDLFYKTHDGGKTWTEYEQPLSVGEWHLNSIAKLGDGTLVIAGETGLLSRSTDGGKTWQLIKGPYTGSYFGIEPFGKKGVLLFGLRGNAYLTKDISQVETLPPDTDLGYKFKKPPTMSGGSDEGGGSEGGGGQQQNQPTSEAEKKKAALAAAEREQAKKKTAKSAWELIKNNSSYLSLMGGTTTQEGGYILVGVNGVIWESDDDSPEVHKLPNTQDGGLSAVAETDDGNLVMVGENGAFLYKRAQ